MKTQLTTEKPVHLDVTLRPGAWVDPSTFIKQIGDAGYAARKDDIRLTLTGKVVKEGSKLVLVVEDVKPAPQRLELLPPPAKNAKAANSWKEALKTIDDAAGRSMEVEGYWTPANTKKDKDALPSLAVLRTVATKPADPPE